MTPLSAFLLSFVCTVVVITGIIVWMNLRR